MLVLTNMRRLNIHVIAMMESLMERAMSDGDWARPARYAMCKGKTSAGFALISLCQMSPTHTSCF